ncbi:hypothetical protein MHU86_10547 [Fragilaria crotonensis]|nr:hypothetical protein MHU86_10547 [Fragilaria crotonensis]
MTRRLNSNQRSYNHAIENPKEFLIWLKKQQSLPPSKYDLKQFMLLLLREQASYVLGVITSTQIPPVTSKQHQDFLIKNKVALVAKTGSAALVESAVTSSFDNKTMAALAQFFEHGGNINA